MTATVCVLKRPITAVLHIITMTVTKILVDYTGTYTNPWEQTYIYTKNKDSFNCYAYAMGYSDRWLIPGKGNKSKYDKNGNPKKGFDLPNYYSVTQVRDWVIKDFKNVVRKASGPNEKVKKGEYLIAM